MSGYFHGSGERVDFYFSFWCPTSKDGLLFRPFFLKFQSFIGSIRKVSGFPLPCFLPQPCLSLKTSVPLLNCHFSLFWKPGAWKNEKELINMCAYIGGTRKESKDYSFLDGCYKDQLVCDQSFINASRRSRGEKISPRYEKEMAEIYLGKLCLIL